MAGFDAYVVALLHYWGEDASTTFSDETGKSWTPSGDAAIDTDQFAFGGSSGIFPSTGGLLTGVHSADFNPGSGDYTWETRARISEAFGSSDWPCLFYVWESGDRGYALYINYNYLYFYYTTDGVTQSYVRVPWTPPIGEWFHLEVGKDGLDLYFFLNGTLVDAKQTLSGHPYEATAAPPRIANDFAKTCWLAETRISKGICRHTENFTPPASAFSRTDGTFSPAAGGDDGYWYGTTFSGGGSGVNMGDGGGPFKAFFRFPSCTIPQGAQIDSCYLKVRANGNTALNTCNLRVAFNAADNAVAPTTYGEGDALAMTDPVDWSAVEAFSDGQLYTSPDLAAALQDVVDREGYDGGNAIMLIVTDNASTNSASRIACAYDYASGTLKAELHVGWTAGPLYMLAPTSEMGLSAHAPTYCLNEYTVPAIALAVSPQPPAAGPWLSLVLPEALAARLSGQAPGYVITDARSAPALALTVTPLDPAYAWTLTAERLATARTIYRCYLEAPGLAAVELPLSSFQARLKADGPSYLSCVIPDGQAYEASIEARAENGVITLRMGYRWPDGKESLETIATADFEDLRVDSGGNSSSATISGHRSDAFSGAAKPWPLAGVSYRSLQEDGRRRYQAAMDLNLRPGDTAVYGEESIVVGEMVLYVSPSQGTLEVVEA